MSTMRHELVGGGIPLDNVQRFERLKSDASELQTLADLQEDIATINALSYELDIAHLYALPVNIRGGLIEVQALDASEGLDTTNRFVKNDTVYGQYTGVAWRRVPSELFEGQDQLYICHKILTGVDDYNDDEVGRKYHVENYSYISIVDSDVEIQSQMGSHDLRRLANDGFALKLDQIAVDENLTWTSKLEMFAKMFGDITSTTEADKQHRLMMLQRLSYLNTLNVFCDADTGQPLECFAIYGYSRTDQSDGSMTVYSNSKGGFIYGTVVGLGLDNKAVFDPETGKYEPDSNTETLCIEVMNDQLGHLSMPYIPDQTFILRTNG